MTKRRMGRRSLGDPAFRGFTVTCAAILAALMATMFIVRAFTDVFRLADSMLRIAHVMGGDLATRRARGTGVHPGELNPRWHSSDQEGAAGAQRGQRPVALAEAEAGSNSDCFLALAAVGRLHELALRPRVTDPVLEGANANEPAIHLDEIPLAQLFGLCHGPSLPVLHTLVPVARAGVATRLDGGNYFSNCSSWRFTSPRNSTAGAPSTTRWS